MPFTGEQAGGRVEADPTRAGQINFAPRMQVGKILFGARGAVEGLYVRLQLDQIARDETRGKAGMAEGVDEQPGRVTARATALGQGLFGRLHPGFEPDDVLDEPVDPAVER